MFAVGIKSRVFAQQIPEAAEGLDESPRRDNRLVNHQRRGEVGDHDENEDNNPFKQIKTEMNEDSIDSLSHSLSMKSEGEDDDDDDNISDSGLETISEISMQQQSSFHTNHTNQTQPHLTKLATSIIE